MLIKFVLSETQEKFFDVHYFFIISMIFIYIIVCLENLQVESKRCFLNLQFLCVLRYIFAFIIIIFIFIETNMESYLD